MRTLRIAALSCALGCMMAAGEVIDRVAVAMDRQAITSSAVEEEVRVSAFENGSPVDLSPKSRRDAADRLVEQSLVRREMTISHYADPADADVNREIETLRKQRTNYESDLADHGLTEEQLRRHLTQELAVLRFIELRFRPAVVVSEQEEKDYYEKQYLPAWKKQNGDNEAPELDSVLDEIEAKLTDSKIDEALDQWISDMKRQVRIHYFEEAFQ